MKTLFNHGNNISIKNNSNNCRGSRGSKDKTLGVSMLKDKLGRACLLICPLIICTDTGSEVFGNCVYVLLPGEVFVYVQSVSFAMICLAYFACHCPH